MIESGPTRLIVQIVPVETEADRLLFGMAMRVISRLFWEIILEGREHERMGNCEVVPGGNCGHLAGDPRRERLLEGNIA